MATQAANLTSDAWKQISTGRETLTLEVVSGLDGIYLCDAPAKPAINAPAHKLGTGFWTIAPPVQGWVRAADKSGARVIWS